ncbi:CRISPR-associated endonuclease Cas2 [Candidatus Micrarchaeota archaeon CG10_big_fil_rev_8_21_14_0_10_45_29]|nr:MAG: CRISPR-associated endonuclease Cas2 [Candidatus Micrarchaeota archaeon CG10_big_fil_rev_8_21_14_0_10_45_29]QBM01559.1 CRISPR-associated endoribonuclease Cas2 [uncultured archaeon]
MIIIAYDIENDKERKKASDICLDFGLSRIQNSVFAGPVSWNKAEAIGMKIDSVCNGERDRVVLFHSCKECSSKMIALKKQRKPEHEKKAFFIVCKEEISSFIAKKSSPHAVGAK